MADFVLHEIRLSRHLKSNLNK